MLNDSLAPAKRALFFFGCMAAVVTGLTFGAGLQMPTDQSSTTVAELRARADAEATRLAAVDRSERGQSAAQRGIPGASKQALADGARVVILR